MRPPILESSPTNAFNANQILLDNNVHMELIVPILLTFNKVTNNHAWNTPLVSFDRERKTAIDEAFLLRLTSLILALSRNLVLTCKY